MKKRNLLIVCMAFLLMPFYGKSQLKRAIVDCRNKQVMCLTACPYCGSKVLLLSPDQCEDNIYNGNNKKYCSRCGESFYYNFGDYAEYIRDLQDQGIEIKFNINDVISTVGEGLIEDQQRQAEYYKKQSEYYKKLNEERKKKEDENRRKWDPNYK